MRKIYNLFLIFIIIPFYAQNSKTEYYSKIAKLDSIVITENKIVGFADTTLVKIKGKIIDSENEGVEETEIVITNLDTKQVKLFKSDENGNYNINIEKGIYSILFRKTRYGKILIQRNEFQNGQIQEINVNFGSRIKIIEYQKIQGKTFTIESKKKRKINKKTIR